MGVVYRAYHAQLERTGAVKVLQGIAPDADSTARFRHEAQAIAQMRHPNILNVFDFGEFEGTPYMIIEYVPGGSLASRMKHGPMAIPDALEYLRGIAAGLDYAHSMGIVHRDVKPANVLLEKDGTPVIADFGLVKLMQSTSLRSMTGVTTGTPAYMAPEQVTGSHAGPAADRYSLATIAYEMLTGVIPFDGGGLMEVLYAQVHRDPPTPSSRRPELGPDVDAVVMRGMAKDPNARWETCEAFVDALEKALSHVAEPALARTAVMSPLASAKPLIAPLASTVKSPAAPAPPAAPLPHTNGVNAGATVAMAYPAAAPEAIPTTVVAQPVTTQKKSRRRLFSLGAAAVLVLLLIGAFAVCAARPSVSLSPSTVAAGESVLVTATRVPANQIGEIQLHSTLRTYPFHAGANGGFTQSIVIPRNTATGDHTVQICWASACHASATLHVIAPVALVTYPPGASPTPGVTPSPGAPSPTPGASPQPTSAPTQNPGTTPRPTSNPGPQPSPRPAPSPSPSPLPSPTPPPQPSPTPTPAPKPTPTPTPPPPPPPPPATLTATPGSGIISGLTTVTVAGQHFTPNKTVTISFYDPSSSATAKKSWTTTASASGTFSVGTVPPLLSGNGTARYTACDSSGVCATAYVSVVA
jgi:serine/threonine-protein kinase